MNSFEVKKIDAPLTLGELLKKGRADKQDSLQQASQKIGVPVKYLEALEEGNYTALPGEAYAKSFLKAYSRFLNVNVSDSLALYKSESTLYHKTRPAEDFRKPVEKISRLYLLATPKLLRGLSVGLLAVVVLISLGVKVKGVVTPSELVLESPIENIITNQNFITVSGKAEKETVITINGQQVVADATGAFSEIVDLRTGNNLIKITATKRHGTETTLYRQVVVVESNNQELITN